MAFLINNRSVYISFNKNNDIIGLDLMYFWYIDKHRTIKLIKAILKMNDNTNKLIYDKKSKILNSYLNDNKLIYDKYLTERYLVCLLKKDKDNG